MSLYDNLADNQPNDNIETKDDNVKFMKTHLKLKRISKPTKLISNPLFVNPGINDSTNDYSNIFVFNFPTTSYDPAQPNEYIAWADKFGQKTKFVLPPVNDTIKPKLSSYKPSDVKDAASTSVRLTDLSSINKTTSNSFGDSFGQAMLAKYGWKEGQGLGKNQQGISVALNVEKIGHNTGKIVDKHAQIKKYLAKLQNSTDKQSSEAQSSNIPNTEQIALKDKTNVILILNMISPDDNEEDVKNELIDECCQKYGNVQQITIHKIPISYSDIKIGIFVEFSTPSSATNAINDLNGRYFGGNSIQALYYDQLKFKNNQIMF